MKSFLLSQAKQYSINSKLFFKIKIKILITKIFSIPLYIFCVPLLLIIKTISPFFLIRIGKLESNRIGHLAGNTELHILEKKIKKNKPNQFFYDIYFAGYYPISNKYLLKLWSRHINIFPKFFIEPLYNCLSLISKRSNHILYFPNKDRDVYNLLDKTKSVVKFTKEEINYGNEFLKKVNPEKKKIICFIIRDNAYLNKHMPLSDMSYHNFRNYNLENYIPAIKKLIELNFFVFRMGSNSEHKINFKDTNLIDLPFSDFRTEFLDIFIGSKCFFTVSTSTGWDAVPAIMFRKPILLCPMVPIGNLFTFSSNYMITTSNFSNSTNKYISQTEIFKMNLANAFDSQEYLNSGFRQIENSKTEILNSVMDMIKFVNREPLNFELNKMFWITYKKNIENYNLQHLHGELKAVISPSFLTKYQNFIK